MKTSTQFAKAFFLTDFYGNINHANLCACKSLGYSREELLNLSLDQVYLEATPTKLANVITKLGPGNPLTLEGKFKNKKGEISLVEIRVCLLKEADNQLIFVFTDDIAEKTSHKIEHNIYDEMAVL